MRKYFKLLIIVLMLFVVAFSSFSLHAFLTQKKPIVARQSMPQHKAPDVRSTPTDNPYSPGDFNVGGFSIDTAEEAAKASAEGVEVAFQYGDPPSHDDALGQQLQSLHMKVIDGYIATYLYYYECHRSKTVKPPPPGQAQFCQKDNYPYLTDQDTLLTFIAAHLKQVKDNQLIIGYWVLDDWVSWDAGNARDLLTKIHDLIQEYTPGRPAICGFGGFIHSNHASGWDDWLADNFSPQACDKVGLYIYTPEVPDTTTPPSANAYDWSMSEVLPAIFASLQRRGWNITKEPLIGIGQAFGGPIANTPNSWLEPTAKDIEIQSKSFCQHGATGLTFYAWDDLGFGPSTLTPMNNHAIETGIQNGIAACKQLWKTLASAPARQIPQSAFPLRES